VESTTYRKTLQNKALQVSHIAHCLPGPPLTASSPGKTSCKSPVKIEVSLAKGKATLEGQWNNIKGPCIRVEDRRHSALFFWGKDKTMIAKHSLRAIHEIGLMAGIAIILTANANGQSIHPPIGTLLPDLALYKPSSR
jgi:hypothetical protein